MIPFLVDLALLTIGARPPRSRSRASGEVSALAGHSREAVERSTTQ